MARGPVNYFCSGGIPLPCLDRGSIEPGASHLFCPAALRSQPTGDQTVLPHGAADCRAASVPLRASGVQSILTTLTGSLAGKVSIRPASRSASWRSMRRREGSAA